MGYIKCDSDDKLASESLAFLVVGLKSFFKIPFGYFLIDKINAERQAILVKDALYILGMAGFNVHAVVCDGSYTNQATATALGCSLRVNNIDTTFKNSFESDSEVLFMFDACHLLKTVRNCLGDLKVLYSNGEEINWKYIQALHELQLDYDLNLCNKLKGKHLNYQNNKMKVSLVPIRPI